MEEEVIEEELVGVYMDVSLAPMNCLIGLPFGSTIQAVQIYFLTFQSREPTI